MTRIIPAARLQRATFGAGCFWCACPPARLLLCLLRLPACSPGTRCGAYHGACTEVFLLLLGIPDYLSSSSRRGANYTALADLFARHPCC